jgi:pyridinium-3,5-bisthiocarboxylic acid mononucleotide nickel chelatase
VTRLAYVDAVGGVAGDMLLAALLDAGADAGHVRDGLRGLAVGGLELRTTTVSRHSISAASVSIVAPPEPHPHRRWAEVRAILDESALPARALERAQRVFAALARAEAHVHGIDPESVIFHEVGAFDAIGDICGIALALESLEIDELACSPLPTPRGLIAAAHGRLPLPAPAVLELLRGAPLYGVDVDAELVTPTGAAVVAALAVEFGPLPPLALERVGYGAGARDLEQLPNLVRVLVGERVATAADDRPREDAVLIEANLDDISPQLLPDAAESCFAAGALDVWIAPVQMKKGRPGFVFSALARPSEERAVAGAILRETTTLGVRVSPVRRWELAREWVEVEIAGEPVRVKLGLLDGAVVNVAPEHDDCLAAARASGRPVKEIWAAALAAVAERGAPR